MRDTVLKMEGLHVTVRSATKGYPTFLFIHGGPGSHAAYFEAAVRELPAYQGAFGWITYDQRGCGRSASGPLTHEQNIIDAINVLRTVKALGTPVDGIVGHSYGAWLAYDCVLKKAAELPRLVMLGLGPDFREPRNRSLIVDLLALKIQSPDVYEHFYPTLRDFQGEPWQIAKALRGLLPSTEFRRHFYWANQEAMRWYDRLKATTPLAESDSVYRSVRETLYSSEKPVSGPHVQEVEVPILWINGLQDFLMSGVIEEHPNVTREFFMGSGHYPHLEEPQKFVDALMAFTKRTK